jgi:hypothetical protein
MHDRLSAPPPIRFNPERRPATVANTSSIVRQKRGVRSSAELLRMAIESGVACCPAGNNNREEKPNGKSSRTLQEAEKR